MRFWIALIASVIFCISAPLALLLIVSELPITWLNIFLVGGAESGILLLAVELAKLVKSLADDC